MLMIADIDTGLLTLQAQGMAATTQAPQLRMPRATSQALTPTASLATSRAAILVVTHPTLAPAQATRAMAATTQAPQPRMPRATSQALTPTVSLATSRAVTLAVTHPTLVPAIRAMEAATQAATLVAA